MNKPRFIAKAKIGNLLILDKLDDWLKIKSIYFVYGDDLTVISKGHAHKELIQIFVAISGKWVLHLNDGVNESNFSLDTDSDYLYLPSGYWRTYQSCEPGSILGVLASEVYNEDDYIRDWDDYVEWKK